jgi:hypothetical protein
MSENLNESYFELNLNFQGHKNPSNAFKQIGTMFDKLIEIDKFVLYNILPTAKIEYELVDLEYGSLKTKTAQILRSIPDDILKDIASPKKLIGIILTYVKYRILKAIETKEVDSRQSLEKVTKDINQKIDGIQLANSLVLNVNNYFILNSINDISIESKKLKKHETFEYISKDGKSLVGNSPLPNMAKILFELGDQKVEQKRVEVLKVKSIDLLSDIAKWKLIRMGKQIDVSILDKEWLIRYHNRQISIQPNDYMKIELKIMYSSTGLSPKPLIQYEAIRVIEVIPPEKIETDSQKDLFEN